MCNVVQSVWCTIILVLVLGEPCGKVDIVCYGTGHVVCGVLQLMCCTIILVFVNCVVWCTTILVLVLVSSVVYHDSNAGSLCAMWYSQCGVP